MWKCKKCGSEIEEDNVISCWNCDYIRRDVVIQTGGLLGSGGITLEAMEKPNPTSLRAKEPVQVVSAIVNSKRNDSADAKQYVQEDSEANDKPTLLYHITSVLVVIIYFVWKLKYISILISLLITLILWYNYRTPIYSVGEQAYIGQIPCVIVNCSRWTKKYTIKCYGDIHDVLEVDWLAVRKEPD